MIGKINKKHYDLWILLIETEKISLTWNMKMKQDVKQGRKFIL